MKNNSIIKYVKYILCLGMLIYCFSSLLINIDKTPEIHFTFSYPNINKIELSKISEKQIYNHLNNLNCDENFDILYYEPSYGEGNRFIEIRYQDDAGYHEWYFGGRLTEHKFYPIDSKDKLCQSNPIWIYKG